MIKPTLLDRYIFKELLSIFLLSLMGLTGVLLLEKIHFLSDLIFNKGVTLAETLLLLFYISPSFLSITIPLSILLASIMGFSRLSAESELVAMKACGLSIYRLMLPVFVISFVAYIASSIITVELQHKGNLLLKNMIFNVLKTRADLQFKERVFNNTLSGMTIYVDKKGDASPVMNGVFIHTEAPKENARIIFAREGRLVPINGSVVLHLIDGTIHEPGNEGESYHLLKFKEYDLKISFNDQEKQGSKSYKGRQEMSVTELKSEIRRLEKEDKDANLLRVEIHAKYAVPFACIAFGILGAPLGIRVNRSGKGASLGVGVVIMVLNYILLVAGRSIGANGILPPIFSMWIPNGMTLGIAILILHKSARENISSGFSVEVPRFLKKKTVNSGRTENR
ncbi:MAG: LPS export ABC transporter permease LptF [Nitrospinota bacterium]